MPMVSIIVTVYNQQNFIKRCMDSIVNQNCQNFEVIIIDDGSSDNSGNLCQQYVSQYPMIKYFYTNNSGVSSARNYGVKQASGEFVGFVDCDDYIELNYIEEMTKLCSDGVNLVCSAVNKIVSESNKSKIYKPTSFINVLNQNPNIRNPVWNKLFRKEIVDKYDIKFPSKSAFAEDFVFITAYCAVGIYSNDDFKITKLPLYNYWRHKSSTMSNIHNNLINSIDECMENVKYLITFFKQNSLTQSKIFDSVVIGYFLLTFPLVMIYKAVLKTKFTKEELNNILQYYENITEPYNVHLNIIHKLRNYYFISLIYLAWLIHI